MNRYLLSLIMLFGILTGLPGARAETTNCTPILTIPTVITTQGVYCFTQHLSTAMTSGIAIDIQTNNVTIDMNGFKLGGLAAGDDTTAYGIYANQRKNIVIRNGTIRGFLRGIWLTDVSPYTTSKGHLVEDIIADGNTFTGIQVFGRSCEMRRNKIIDTGGSTVFSSAYGITTHGPGSKLIDNSVSATHSVGLAPSYGLLVADADGTIVKDNVVSDTTSAGAADSYGLKLESTNGAVVVGNTASNTSDGGAISYGVYITSSVEIMLRDNTVTSADFGFYYLGSSGKYMGNLTDDIAGTAYTGGTAVGTNN